MVAKKLSGQQSLLLPLCCTAVVVLLLLMAGPTLGAPVAQVIKGSESNSGGDGLTDSSFLASLESSPLFWIATLVVFSVGIMLCAGGEDTVAQGQQPEVYSEPQGAIRSNTAYDPTSFSRPGIAPPMNQQQALSRPPIPTPHKYDPNTPKREAPTGVFVDSTPSKVLEKYFVRLNGQFIEVTESEAAHHISQGNPVFTQPDRSQAGVDIYAELPSSHDLYSVVGAKDNFTPDNLYSMPTKPPRSNGPANPPSSSHSAPPKPQPKVPKSNPVAAPRAPIPDDYEDPDKVGQALPTPAELEYFGNSDVALWAKQPGLTRPRAEQLLTGKPAGTFLFRQRDGGTFALALCSQGRVCHYKVEKLPSGEVFIFIGGLDIRRVTFRTMAQLINHYREFDPQSQGGLGARLAKCLPYVP